jgi:hypothetical protein
MMERWVDTAAKRTPPMARGRMAEERSDIP